VARRPARRADHEELVGAVGQVAQRDGVRGAGTRSGGGEQEQAGSVERAADPAGVGAELGDDLLLEVDVHSGGRSSLTKFGNAG
jgi:hypothetical protein